MAEDARIITIRKMRAEELANERAAQEKLAADANAQSQLDQQRRAQAEMDRQAADTARQAADTARQQAEQAKMNAEQAAAQATQQMAMADAARQDALAQQQASKAEADRMRMAAQQSEAEKTQLRERLRLQFNAILETRETARGLIVNISDVLFDCLLYTSDVGGLQIAVHNARLVRGGETSGHLNGDVEDFLQRHGPFGDRHAQCHAIHHFGDDIGNAALHADVVDGQNIGVVQAAGGARFQCEAALLVGIHGAVSMQNLDGHVALQPGIPGAVDLSHAPGPQKIDDPVGSQRTSRIQSHAP